MTGNKSGSTAQADPKVYLPEEATIWSVMALLTWGNKGDVTKITRRSIAEGDQAEVVWHIPMERLRVARPTGTLMIEGEGDASDIVSVFWQTFVLANDVTFTVDLARSITISNRNEEYKFEFELSFEVPDPPAVRTQDPRRMVLLALYLHTIALGRAVRVTRRDLSLPGPGAPQTVCEIPVGGLNIEQSAGGLSIEGSEAGAGPFDQPPTLCSVTLVALRPVEFAMISPNAVTVMQGTTKYTFTVVGN
jgi:hypothetical protein